MIYISLTNKQLESKNPRSIPLNEKDEITLNQLLTSAIVTASPNAILMLANTVIKVIVIV